MKAPSIESRCILLILAAIGMVGSAHGEPSFDDAGYAMLFDGRSLDGWQTDENGVSYYGSTQFRNFILTATFKIRTTTATSNVVVRAPEPVTVSGSLQQTAAAVVTVGNDASTGAKTGTLRGVKEAENATLKSEWNDLEITCIANNYYVRLNGVLVNVAEAQLGDQGRIGVQHLTASKKPRAPIQFGSIRVKQLPDDALAYHVIFDGVSTEGWKLLTRKGGFLHNKQEGTIVTKGRALGVLWHRQSFRNFILMLEWKVSQQSDNSGVHIRFPDPSDDPWIVDRRGYEIQIDDTGRPQRRTGSVLRMKDASSIPTKPVGEWNHYEIQADGQQYIVRINGQTVTEFEGDRETQGYIGLQNHNSRSHVSFRNIRVVELAD